MTYDKAIAYMESGTLKTDTCWVWLGPRQKPQGRRSHHNAQAT